MERIEREKATQQIDLFISKKKVTLQEGDGNALNALTLSNKKMFEVTPRYLGLLVVKIGSDGKINEDKVLDLLVVDQEWTLVENYKWQYGNILELEDVPCPNQKCGRPNDHTEDLSDLEIIQLPVELQGSEDPTITIQLPRSGYTAVIGMLNGHQEKKLLAQQASGKFDLNQADFQCLRELNGAKVGDFYYEDVVALPLLDHKEIRKARKRLICGYKTIVNMNCGYCGTTWDFNFLSHKSFLIPAG